jgi:hypothetical protein
MNDNNNIGGSENPTQLLGHQGGAHGLVNQLRGQELGKEETRTDNKEAKKSRMLS